MALTPPVLLIAILIMGIAHVYCSDTCQQKGTQWFQEDLESEQTITHYPRDCTEILKQGNTSSGYYTIQPIAPQGLYPDTQDESRPVNVYCDMDTDGGGWTVFQRRLNGKVDFYRGWEEYQRGFGYLEGDYWLGLENIHRLTADDASYELRIDLEDFYGNTAYAHYDQFHVKDEGNLYKLYVGTYQGTAGDDLRDNINQPFSTKDQDHDSYSRGLYPDVSNKGRPVNVYCDMDTDGGGWTVFQRRLNGVVGFDRDWKDYKHGFGYLEGDYWLGLENIHKLTTTASYELRIDLESFWANERYMYYAHYDQFHIKDEANLYKLYIGEYQGTAPDALRGNNNQPFVTRDQNHEDNTCNCATERKGAWWYTDCHWLKSDSCGLSNLNGIFGAPQTTNTGMSWHGQFSCKDSFIRTIHVFKLSEMKIRRMDK